MGRDGPHMAACKVLGGHGRVATFAAGTGSPPPLLGAAMLLGSGGARPFSVGVSRQTGVGTARFTDGTAGVLYA